MKHCGCQEPCFERGPQWGHLEGVMCKHMTERVDNTSCCGKNNEDTVVYTTEAQYIKLNDAG